MGSQAPIPSTKTQKRRPRSTHGRLPSLVLCSLGGVPRRWGKHVAIVVDALIHALEATPISISTSIGSRADPRACPGSPPMSALLPSFSATNGARPSPEPASTDQQHCTLPRLPHTGARSRTQYHTQPCDALAARHGAMGLSEDPGQRASSFRPVHDPPSVTPSQSRVRAPPTPRALLVAARSPLCRPCELPLRHPRGMLAGVARMHGLRCRTAMLLVTVPTSPSLCTSAL